MGGSSNPIYGSDAVNLSIFSLPTSSASAPQPAVPRCEWPIPPPVTKTPPYFTPEVTVVERFAPTSAELLSAGLEQRSHPSSGLCTLFKETYSVVDGPDGKYLARMDMIDLPLAEKFDFWTQYDPLPNPQPWETVFETEGGILRTYTDVSYEVDPLSGEPVERFNIVKTTFEPTSGEVIPVEGDASAANLEFLANPPDDGFGPFDARESMIFDAASEATSKRTTLNVRVDTETGKFVEFSNEGGAANLRIRMTPGRIIEEIYIEDPAMDCFREQFLELALRHNEAQLQANEKMYSDTGIDFFERSMAVDRTVAGRTPVVLSYEETGAPVVRETTVPAERVAVGKITLTAPPVVNATPAEMLGGAVMGAGIGVGLYVANDALRTGAVAIVGEENAPYVDTAIPYADLGAITVLAPEMSAAAFPVTPIALAAHEGVGLVSEEAGFDRSDSNVQMGEIAITGAIAGAALVYLLPYIIAAPWAAAAAAALAIGAYLIYESSKNPTQTEERYEVDSADLMW